MFTKWRINVNKSGGDIFFSHHLKIRNFSFVRISDFLFTTHGARRYSIKRTTSGIGFLGKSLLVDLIKRPLVYLDIIQFHLGAEIQPLEEGSKIENSDGFDQKSIEK